MLLCSYSNGLFRWFWIVVWAVIHCQNITAFYWPAIPEQDGGGDNKMLKPLENRMAHVTVENDAPGLIEKMKIWGGIAVWSRS